MREVYGRIGKLLLILHVSSRAPQSSMSKSSGFIISATSSGSGKTTFSLGLMRALRDRGLRVQPFKCGPDYIDTQFHGAACGRPSVNLDTFMASEAHVADLFSRYASKSDVCVVEGVMGLFDGYDKIKGSSADLSRLLGLPVILLINAASSAYSLAATIHGFISFRPEVRVAGVVFNRVASPGHLRLLQAACADAGAECLGYIARSEGLQTPSRHLGLTLSGREEMETFIHRAAAAVSENVDIDRILSLTEISEDAAGTPAITTAIGQRDGEKLRVAVARDEAFSFIYPENLKAFGRAEIVYFSPIHDSILPEADIIYLPGGYPELYAEDLAKNRKMRSAIADYIENGGRMLAECGGMIYLTRDIDGKEMCGIIPTSTTMENAKLTLGYRTVELPEMKLKGHEFHYSRLVNPDVLPSVARQRDVRGKEVSIPLYRYKNCFAGYTHLYWGESGIRQLWN